MKLKIYIVDNVTRTNLNIIGVCLWRLLMMGREERKEYSNFVVDEEHCVISADKVGNLVFISFNEPDSSLRLQLTESSFLYLRRKLARIKDVQITRNQISFRMERRKRDNLRRGAQKRERAKRLAAKKTKKSSRVVFRGGHKR